MQVAASSSSISNRRINSKYLSINLESAVVMRRRLERRGDIRAMKNALKYLQPIFKMINSILADNVKYLKSNETIVSPLFV